MLGTHTQPLSLERANLNTFTGMAMNDPGRPAQAREVAALCGPVLHGMAVAHTVAVNAVAFDYEALWGRRMEADLPPTTLIPLFERDYVVLEFCCRQLKNDELHDEAEELRKECGDAIFDLLGEIEATLADHLVKIAHDEPEQTDLDEAGSFAFEVAEKVKEEFHEITNLVLQIKWLIPIRSLYLDI